MATFFGVSGVVILVAGLAAILFFTLGELTERAGKLLLVHDDKVRQLSAREIGTRIVQSYHWFSEDDTAMEAVKAVGEQLTHGGYWFDADAARNRWRKVIYTVAPARKETD